MRLGGEPSGRPFLSEVSGVRISPGESVNVFDGSANRDPKQLPAGYFSDLVAERKKRPTSDITSIVANAKVNGAELQTIELLSFYLLLVVAGNETTRNATTGGLLALIQNPDEFRRLQQNPRLIKIAVEEISRVFCREYENRGLLDGERGICTPETLQHSMGGIRPSLAHYSAEKSIRAGGNLFA